MNPTEINIIEIIEGILKSDKDEVSDARDVLYLFKKLTQEPFGSSTTEEFINHPALNTFFNNKEYHRYQLFKPTLLWFRIEDYLTTKSNDVLSKEKLILVEKALKECLSNMTSEAKSRGTAMLPSTLANQQFMRNLFSLNDEKLSAIFLKYLPAPRSNIFTGQKTPKIIADREQDTTQSMINTLKRAKEQGIESSFESSIIKVQRKFRSKERKNEDLERVSARHNITKDETRKLLKNANTPYTPQCNDKELASRIVNASKNIELFSTVRHLTAASAIESIFNDGLYGRRTILQFYMPFKPSALFDFDIEEGDSNVVCLGANEIDSGAAQGIQLQFDARKISENNPCVFFKQRDLGFTKEKIRELKIGDLEIGFSHTNLKTEEKVNCPFKLYEKNENLNFNYTPIASAKIKNTLLISYNLEKMHQILTLNFFRFIDNLDDKTIKEKIYSALSKLDDEMLTTILKEIGVKMTDTMEFNFYGAYKIDFSALLRIKNDKTQYRLDLQTFVDELKAGNVSKLREAMENLPEIFNSYRFIDYLLSNTKNETIISELSERRQNCTHPSWIEAKKH